MLFCCLSHSQSWFRGGLAGVPAMLNYKSNRTYIMLFANCTFHFNLFLLSVSLSKAHNKPRNSTSEPLLSASDWVQGESKYFSVIIFYFTSVNPLNVLEVNSPDNVAWADPRGCKSSPRISSFLYLHIKIFLSPKPHLSCALFVTSSSSLCPLSVILYTPTPYVRRTNLSLAKEGPSFCLFLRLSLHKLVS